MDIQMNGAIAPDQVPVAPLNGKWVQTAKEMVAHHEAGQLTEFTVDSMKSVQYLRTALGRPLKDLGFKMRTATQQSDGQIKVYAQLTDLDANLRQGPRGWATNGSVNPEDFELGEPVEVETKKSARAKGGAKSPADSAGEPA